jgi:hypothetical protein
MNSLKVIVMLLSTISIITFSCKVDEEKPTLPNISFKSGAGYISSDTTLTVTEPFIVGITASSTTDKNLASVKFTRVYEVVDEKTIFDFPLSAPSFSFDTSLVAHPNAGSEDFICTVTDKNGLSNSISFNIITESAQPDLIVYENVILGAQQSDTAGVAFSTVNGNIYSLEQAFAVSEIIDFLYFYNPGTFVTLGAPDDDATALAYNDPNFGTNLWAVKNSTRFKTSSLNTEQFDEIQYYDQIVLQAIPLPNLPTVGELTNNNIIVFILEDESFGILRIDEVVPGLFGYVKMTVKIGED